MNLVNFSQFFHIKHFFNHEETIIYYLFEDFIQENIKKF